MAILSFNIVSTLIAISVWQKLSLRWSFGRWLLSCRLFRYLPPTTEELRCAITGRDFSQKIRRRNIERKSGDAEGFLVPKNVEINLTRVSIGPLDLLRLPFYEDFRSLVDFSCFCLAVYSVAEVFFYLNMESHLNMGREVNLSVVWCFVVLFLCLRSLARLTRGIVWDTTEGGERSVMLCFGTVYFLLSMAFVMTAEYLFDIDFSKGYKNFTSMANDYLKSQDLAVLGHAERSPVVFFVFCSAFFGCLAAMLVFPNFRYANMYVTALRHNVDSNFTRLTLHVTFLSPILVLFLWTCPVAEYLLNGPRFFLTIDQLDSVRLLSLLTCSILRSLTFRAHLQAHLNLAADKLKSMQNEAGRINSLELQRMIFRYFSYSCAVALYLAIPLLLQLILTMILKTLGGYSWLVTFGLPPDPLAYLFDLGQEKQQNTTVSAMALFPGLQTLLNVTVCRAICQYLLLTVILINFTESLIGLAYNTSLT